MAVARQQKKGCSIGGPHPLDGIVFVARRRLVLFLYRLSSEAALAKRFPLPMTARRIGFAPASTAASEMFAAFAQNATQSDIKVPAETVAS